MLTRLPSIFFIISLLFYYVPKIMRKPNRRFTQLHILTGGMAIFLTLLVMCIQIGTVGWTKYIGFSAIMLGIGLTGVGLLKGKSQMRKYHKWGTIGFFLYLILIIVL